MAKFYGTCQSWAIASVGHLMDPTDVPEMPSADEDYNSRLFFIKRKEGLGLGLWIGSYFPDQTTPTFDTIDQILETYDKIRVIQNRLGLELFSLKLFDGEMPLNVMEFSNKAPFNLMGIGMEDVHPENFVGSYTRLRSCYLALELTINQRFHHESPLNLGSRVVL